MNDFKKCIYKKKVVNAAHQIERAHIRIYNKTLSDYEFLCYTNRAKRKTLLIVLMLLGSSDRKLFTNI